MMNSDRPLPASFCRNLETSLLTDGSVRLGFTWNDSDLCAIQRLFPEKQTIELQQVHGGIILDAQYAVPMQKGDGLFSKSTRFVPVIRTADCIPLFFWNPQTPFFGILHVGWRGFVSRIQEKLFEIMGLQQVKIEETRFLIGPAICADHYPVGPEVIAEFTPFVRIEEIATPRKDGRILLNLKKALRLDLIALGASARKIDDCGLCTYENLELPSYRRQKNGARIYNFIAWD